MLGWFKKKFGRKAEEPVGVEPGESGQAVEAAIGVDAATPALAPEADATLGELAEIEAVAAATVSAEPEATVAEPEAAEEEPPAATEPSSATVVAAPVGEFAIETEPAGEERETEVLAESAAPDEGETVIASARDAATLEAPESTPPAGTASVEPASDRLASEPLATVAPEPTVALPAAESLAETPTAPESEQQTGQESAGPAEIEPVAVEAEAEIESALSEPESAGAEVGPDESAQTEVLAAEIEEERATVATALDRASARTQEKPKAKSMFQRLQERLGKTRDALVYRLDRLFLGKKEIDQDLFEQLEEILITADLGVATTLELLDQARKKVKRDQLSDPQALKAILRDQILAYIESSEQPAELVMPEQGPFVIMVVGVNGVGKTTTIGKIAAKFVRSGQSVLLVAADTFRAAAINQLRIWGERVGVEVIAQKPGADPSSVVFDGLEYGLTHDREVIIIDTAGRLHTSVNLMEELKKIRRVMGKKLPGAPHEVLLVLDATTGQNGIAQAKMFHQAVGVTGLALTKLDGTAKGGIVANVCREIRIPVRFIGIGEQIDDLRDFDAREFVDALFSQQAD